MFATKWRMGRNTLRNSISGLHHAIPKKLPSKPKEETVAPKKISLEIIQHLERLSLVNFANSEGIERLEAAILLADKIKDVDTVGVAPLYTILEEKALFLRSDAPNGEDVDKRSLLRLASSTEEDYYTAPQGNVPLESSQSYNRY